MQNSFTLLLASRAAILLQHFGPSLEKAWLMPYGQANMHDLLGKALLARSGAPLSIYLDQQNLEIKADSLPPVSGWQYEKILARQRGYHFPQADISGSRLEKRKEGLCVIHGAAALNDEIQKTLTSLYHIANQVEPLGFYPLELLNCVRALEGVPQPATCLMLFLGEATGLRQIIVKNGIPVLTRLNADCVPSNDQEKLVAEIAAQIKSTKDYLPRLDGALDASIPVILFVPPVLQSLSARPELQQESVQLVALEPPRPDLVPEAWGLDVALLARLAGQKKRYLPFTPDWLKGRHQRFILRQDVSILMFVFGCAGIAFGLETLLGPKFFTQGKAPTEVALSQPSAAPVVPVIAPPPASVSAPAPVELEKPASELIAPPDLKLEAIMYNSPQDWAVWINGKKYTPEDSEGAITIEDVSDDAVRVLWQQGESRKEIMLKLGGASTGAVAD